MTKNFFDLEKLTTELDITVSESDIVIMDNRTGETMKTAYYYIPGGNVRKHIAQQLSHFGYSLISMSEPIETKGALKLNEVWGEFIQEEGINDRFELPPEETATRLGA